MQPARPAPATTTGKDTLAPDEEEEAATLM